MEEEEIRASCVEREGLKKTLLRTVVSHDLVQTNTNPGLVSCMAQLRKMHPDVFKNWDVLMRDLGARAHPQKLCFPPANDKILRP